MRTTSGVLDSQFAADFLNGPTGRLQIDQFSRQIIGMTNINAEEIKRIRIPLPPFERQIKLVEAMDMARSNRRAKMLQADDLLGGLDGFLLDVLGLVAPQELNRKVFGVRHGGAGARLDPHFHSPDFARIQSMLAAVKSEPLGELVSFSKEVWDPMKHKDPTFRYVEISGVNPKTGEATYAEVATAEAPSRARMLLHSGDIIVSLTRPHHGSIAQIPEAFDGYVASTGFAVIRGVVDRLRPDYLWSALRAQFCLKQMLQRASGGNYPAITELELCKVLIPVPDLEVQKVVAAEVRRRRDEAQSLRALAESEWQEAKLVFEEQLLESRRI